MSHFEIIIAFCKIIVTFCNKKPYAFCNKTVPFRNKNPDTFCNKFLSRFVKKYLSHVVINFYNKTKCDNYFITQCEKSLLQNASAFLSQILFQNVTDITKCNVYYQMRRYNLSKLRNVIKVSIIFYHILSFNIDEYPQCD